MSEFVVKDNPVFKLVSSVAFRLTIVASSFAVFLISSYLFGPEGRGIISFVGSFFFTASLILSLGLGRVIYQKITLDPASAEKWLSCAVGFVYLLSALCLLLIAVISFTMPQVPALSGEAESKYFLFMFGLFPYNVWMNFSNYLFSAIQKTEKHERYIFTTRVFQVVILLSLIFLRPSLDLFLGIYGLTGILIFIIESRLLVAGQSFMDIVRSLRSLKELLPFIKWPYIDSIALASYPFVIFLIGFYVDNKDLGNYHFALQMLSALVFPFNVAQIKIQEKLANFPESSMGRYLFRQISMVFAGGIGIAFLGWAIPYALPYLGLRNFVDASEIIKSLLFVLPLQGVILFLQGVWVGLHRSRLSSFVNLGYGAITILCVFIFAPRYGVWSGVLGTISGSVILLAIQVFILMNLSKNNMLSRKEHIS